MNGRRYAVLVGNGSYPGEHPDGPPRLPPLNCPIRDVGGLREILEAESHGGYQVTALIDRPHSESRRSIYDCLRKAGPEDQVVIFYSGHGKVDENGNLYLAGSDTDPESLDPTALAAADVQKYVTESRAASRIVILDCCFSGAVGQSFLRGAAKGELADQAGQAVRRLEGQGVFYLTASTDTQTAEEKEHDRYSLLTKFIISGIGDGEADADDDGEVSFSELCKFVQEKVRLEGTQRPLSFTLKGYGDPVVALTGRAAFAARRDAIEQQVYELRRQKMLHGADAAKLLSRLHRPATERIGGAVTVQTLLQELYAARSDPALFLRAVLRSVNLSEEQAAVGPSSSFVGGLSPIVARRDGVADPIVVGAEGQVASQSGRLPPRPATRVPVSPQQDRPGNSALGKRTAWTALLSLVVVGSLVAAFWVLNPFGRSSENASNSGSPSANMSDLHPANTPAGTLTVQPSAPLLNAAPPLINHPSKLLAAPNTK